MPLPEGDCPRGTRPYGGALSENAWAALETIWEEPFTVSSNFARECAEEIALLASIGWISTVSPDGRNFSRLWRITGQGFTALMQRSALE